MAILGKGSDVSQLGYRNGKDWTSNNLQVYANYVEFGGKEQSIFEEDSYTLIYIKRSEEFDALGTTRENNTSLQVDENRIDGSKLKLRNRTTLSIYATENKIPLFEKEAVLFTIGEPIDQTKYFSGEQEVYVSRQSIPSEINEQLTNTIVGGSALSEGLISSLEALDEDKNITAYDFVNIQEINNITNSVVLFTNQRKITKPTSLKFIYDKSYGLHRMFANGSVDGDYQPINLKMKDDSSNFALIKLAPVSTQNKVVLKSDSTDRAQTLPYEFLKQFTGITKGLRATIVSDNQTYKKDLWQLFLSILELTKAFSNGFADYQIEGNDGRSGVNPKAKIGGIKIGLLSGTSSNDALDAISGRIENWRSTHPTFINSNEFKLFKVYCNMLTPFIQSKYSLGGGLNQLNKIDHLWYFDMRTSINGASNDEQTNGFASNINQDVVVQLKSEFYDISSSNGDLTLKDKFKELSKYQTLDLDGEISFGELPLQLEPMNLPAIPSSKNISDDSITKYYIYIPVDDQTQLQKIYGGTKTKTSVGGIEVTKQFITKKGEDNMRTASNNNYTNEKYLNEIEVPSSSYPTTPSDIYTQIIKNSLSNKQEMKFINGVPDVRDIEIKLIDSGKSGIYCNSYGPNPDNPYPARVCVEYAKTSYATYQISFTYKITEKDINTDLLFSEGNTTFDKQGIIDLTKLHYNKPNVELDLDFNYSNTNNTVDVIDSVQSSGMLGNNFSIEMTGKQLEEVVEEVEVNPNGVLIILKDILNEDNQNINSIKSITFEDGNKTYEVEYIRTSGIGTDFWFSKIVKVGTQDIPRVKIKMSVVYDRYVDGTINIDGLEFTSKFTESNTKTKINL